MEPKQRLFIYDRKEMAILVLLGALLALFSFTLGVHLGKRVAVQAHDEHAKEAEPLAAGEEDGPNRQEVPEQTPKMDEATTAIVDQAIKKEVEETKLKIDHPRQVQLPGETKGEKAEAAPEHKAEAEQPKAKAESKVENKAEAKHSGHVKEQTASKPKSDAHHDTVGEPVVKYMLQVGSYPSEAEAKARALSLKPSGLATLVFPVKIEGKGTWYRVYMGAYNTVDQANAAGKELQKNKVVESFIVANRPENQ